MSTTTYVAIGAVIVFGIYFYFSYLSFIADWEKRNGRGAPNACPDTFRDEGNDVCRNVQNIGNCPKDPNGNLTLNGTVSFADSKYKGPDGPMEKCKWSKRCNVPWEGIDTLCV